MAEGEIAERRAALRRWVVFAIAYQGAVVVFAVAYFAILAGRLSGGAWAAPAIGAVVGAALPLQVVVASLLRALR